jgi:hypothetical protein
MQNVHAISRPVSHVLSNGALAFAVSQILCTVKWRKPFTKTVSAFNLHFQHMYMTQLTGKQSPPFEKALLGLEATLRFSF